MSGTNYDTQCPRCGRNNLDMYSDTKPWDTVTGICLDCGFTITSGILVNLEEARELVADFDYEPPKFTKEERAQIREFDRCYNPEVMKCQNTKSR